MSLKPVTIPALNCLYRTGSDFKILPRPFAIECHFVYVACVCETGKFRNPSARLAGLPMKWPKSVPGNK
eukprot:1235293-Rhodomonas_salina.4